MHEIQQSREKFATERLDSVDIAALFLRHREKTLIEFASRQGTTRFHQNDAGARMSRLCRSCASVAIRRIKVLDGLPADKKVLELAIDDDIDRLRRDALVIDRIS